MHQMNREQMHVHLVQRPQILTLMKLVFENLECIYRILTYLLIDQ
jgi:hypothetical protein